MLNNLFYPEFSVYVLTMSSGGLRCLDVVYVEYKNIALIFIHIFVVCLYFRANLKRWSELVAKKKLENKQQNEAAEEANEEKVEMDEEKMDDTKREDNNDGIDEVPPSPPSNSERMKTLVESIKTETSAADNSPSDNE